MVGKAQNTGRIVMSGHVDASPVNKELTDAYDDVGPIAKEKGEEHGEKYGDGLGARARRSLEKHAPTIAKMLDDKLDGERVGDNLGDETSRSFTKRMAARSKEIGSRVGGRLGDDIGENIADRLEMAFAGMLDDLEDRIETLTKRVGSARGNTAGGTMENLGPPPIAQQRLERAYRMDEEFDKSRHIMVERAYKMNEDFDRQRAVMIERAHKMNEDRDRQWDKMLTMAHKMNFQFDKKRHLMLEEAYRMNALHSEGRLSGDGRRQRAPIVGGVIDLPDRIGSIFGAGSRNNFLNILGKSMTKVLRLTEMVRKGASSMFGTFMEGFKGAEQGANFLQRAMAGVSAVGARAGAGASKMFSSLAASGPAAAVAIAAVVALLSVMASVLGALIGIVTALTATIVSGLTAALTVAGGALLAVVAAGGLLTAAFMSMTNAQRTALKEAFEPLRNSITGLGQVMMEQMVGVFPVWSANLQRAVAMAGPLAAVMGQAFAQAGSILTESLSGAGFQKLTQALGVYLPSIVQGLSLAFGNFMNGITGMFASVMPMVSRFSWYLAEVTKRFMDWASSAEGENAIVNFTERGVESLKSLWGFVTEFAGFLKDILFSPEAQDAGNTMFDAMRDAFERFRAAIASGDLERWFEDAIQFGGALWEVMKSLADVFFALYDSGTIDGIAVSLKWLAGFISDVGALMEPLVWLVGKAGEMFDGFNGVLSGVPGMLSSLLGPLGAVLGQLERAAALVRWTKDLLGMGGGGSYSPGSIVSDAVGDLNSRFQREVRERQKKSAPGGTDWTSYLRDSGKTARDNTYQKYGGLMPDPTSGGSSSTKAKPEYKNPYEDWANSLIRQGPPMRTEIRLAVRKLRRDGVKAIREEAKSTNHETLAQNLLGNVNDMKKQGSDFVKNAQNALNTAARSLASASSPEAAKAALKQVKKAQKDLRYAQKQQKRLDKAADIINKQRYASRERAQRLLSGRGALKGTTLADYALARQSLAIKIEEANQKLADAIAMRDDYAKAVSDAAKAFGALTSAQAKMINGVEQAMTASDITDNLQERLGKMRKFQENLRLLLASGLSDAAYKQIVDAGVDGGSEYAQALVDGGVGAIGEVNNLVQQINSTADALGKETSSRLYQAGVDAAQGLLDGLTKLDAQLEKAAFALGQKIAAQVKRALGIKSPSRVAIGLMGDFGDGLEGGLDDQHAKVIRAANDLANLIAVRPGGPSLGELRLGTGSPGTVSGNSAIAGDVNLTVVTPTKDPVAVAHETMNELTGRLP